ncbi:IclR family transcriptional regulator [Hoeflea poritis]|uniref:IclR family transcriptional regulator n=1 Tax=Hoeflea poritis TaxID=2993659 RepID=A0ABT4VUD8_9HYPH|nr:IclR family transcriptional regulator [Hoeflea poritis]MDA4848322.1 IclR family transcriptional regulator [Hoeflea poritis]
MGTVDKALSLLDFFSESRPEIGLSELARMAGYDKATVLRLMTALADRGFVEQNVKTRDFRLGPALLRLAHIREASLPQRASAQPILERMSAESGETVHLLLLGKNHLETIDFIEASAHAMRVYMDAGERIPLHASASGLACLAHMPVEEARTALSGALRSYTDHTITDASRILSHLDNVRKTGIAEIDQAFEDGVYGMAGPIFASDGSVTGAVGIATPSSRVTDAFRSKAHKIIRKAASDITRAWGGVAPEAGNEETAA